MAYAITCRHPHLTQADKDINRAFTQLTDAQKANEYDLGGHAAKAKELLDEAKHEVHDAIEWKATHNCK
jgi:DnaJ-class molecular chaperone